MGKNLIKDTSKQERGGSGRHFLCLNSFRCTKSGERYSVGTDHDNSVEVSNIHNQAPPQSTSLGFHKSTSGDFEEPQRRETQRIPLQT